MTVFCKKTPVSDAVKDGKLVFTFSDKGDPIVFDINKAPKVQVELALHGASQKIGDSYAGAGGDFAAARKTAQAVIDNLYAGDWKAARAAGEPRLTLIVSALALATGQSEESCVAVVEKAMETDEKNGNTDLMKQLRNHPDVKVARTTIQSARAKKQQAAAKDVGNLKDLFAQ